MAISQKEFIKAVSDRAQPILKGEGIEIPIEQTGRMIERVMSVGLESMIIELKKYAAENGGEASISFKNLIEICISNRESEDGEKDGNQMISIIPGPQAKMLAKQDDATENDAD